MTDMEAIPPMMPRVCPSAVVSVLSKVCPRESPNFSMGHLEVKAVAVAVRKAEVTKTIITMVKRINKANPGVPSVRLAICAMDLPFSCRLTKSVVKSCTAPMNIPPRTTHNQAGTNPYNIPMVGPRMGPAPEMLEK